MSKINPFVLIAVLLAALLLSAYKVSSLKDDLKNGSKETLLLEDEAKRLSFSKKTWDKANLEARLKNVFGDNKVADKGKSFEVKMSSLNKQDANNFISKAFGETYEIEKFALIAENEDSWSLILEINK
jgi:hypothetical protein